MASLTPLDCENIFDDLDITLTDEHTEIDKVCVEVLRDLAKRDDWLEQVIILVNTELLKICDRVNAITDCLDPCFYNCLYPVSTGAGVGAGPYSGNEVVMPVLSTDPGTDKDWAEDGFYLAHHDGVQWWFIPKITI